MGATCRHCIEDGCDRPAGVGDERCELHAARLGPSPRRLQTPVVVAALDVAPRTPAPVAALAPVHPGRARALLAGAGSCQAVGFGALVTLAETLRFLGGSTWFPSLGLIDVPFSPLLAVALPASFLVITAAQLLLAGLGLGAAAGRLQRNVAILLLVSGAVTALVALTLAIGLFALVIPHPQ